MQGRRNGRSRLAAVRLGRSPTHRGGSSGRSSAGRKLCLPAHPTQGPRSQKRAEDGRSLLKRSASEPALWYDACVHPGPQQDDLSPPSPPPPPLERPHTCYDVFASYYSPFANSASLPDRRPLEVRWKWNCARSRSTV